MSSRCCSAWFLMPALLALSGWFEAPAAQPGLKREIVDLAKARKKMAGILAKMPDYTCLETITRTERSTAKGRLNLVDLLHLEVTQAGDRELYSQSGGQSFQEKVTDLVGNGLISTGQFTLTARAVFLSPATQIQYAGEELLKSRRALKYNFIISPISGGWTLNFGAHTATVGSSGSFWADAESLDVMRLEKRADDLPPDLTFSQVNTSIDYGRVQIGPASALLPQSAEVVLGREDGELYVNHVEFSQCREYRASSSIRFGDAAEARIEEVTLPANLEISLILEQPVDSESNLAGDLVMARVEAEVKAKGQVLVPRGALVHGRIRQLEGVAGPKPHFVIALEFSEIEFGNKRAIFAAQLQRVEGASPMGRIEVLRSAELPGVGTFTMDGRRVRLESGLKLRWRTIDLKR